VGSGRSISVSSWRRHVRPVVLPDRPPRGISMLRKRSPHEGRTSRWTNAPAFDGTAAHVPRRSPNLVRDRPDDPARPIRIYGWCSAPPIGGVLPVRPYRGRRGAAADVEGFFSAPGNRLEPRLTVVTVKCVYIGPRCYSEKRLAAHCFHSLASRACRAPPARLNLGNGRAPAPA